MTQEDDGWQPPPGSWASSPGNRRSMLGNRGRDTSPEIAVRKLLHRAGLRYRVDIRPEQSVPRKADIVFTRRKVAVFIDGCFWHGCPDDFAMPKTNREYWEGKIGGNQVRDAATTTALEAAGWTVLRFWGHEEPGQVAQTIIDSMRINRLGDR